jgi:hypothetical protein
MPSKPPPPKHPVEMRVHKLQFIGEQDGLPEQLLKDRLTEFFQRDKSVQKVYLAKITIGNEIGVALCLKSQFGPDRGLAEKIGSIFKTIFNAREHLDILFLNRLQETQLARVCGPFFEKAA